MVFKRHFGEEGNDESSSPTKFHKVVKYVMKETYLQEIADKIAIRLEHTFRKVLKEELAQHIAACNQSSSPRRSLVYQPESLASRGFELRFIKNLPSTLFTNTRIADEEHSPLQLHLIDANSKNGIHHGKLSSIKLEIVVLNGDFLANGRENWSENEFTDNIVRQREGKRPLLIGDLSVVLVNGVCSLGNVCFTDNSSWIRSRKFKLGVRAMTASGSVGIGIKEAVSEAFVVLDHRGESYQKHNTPSLEDPVWRLKKIAKLGASHQKLVSYGITTVKDFLTHYNMNPSSLRNVLGKGVANRAWETMVKHANECHLDNTYYRYSDDSNCVELVFNCVYKVIAVKFRGRDYQTTDSLDSHHKALVEELKQSALMNPNEIVPFHVASAISSPLELPTTGNNSLISSSQLNLQHDDFSTIDQDKQVNQMDFNLLDTASYPGTAEGCSYLPEDDSTSRTDPPVTVDEFLPPTFMTGNSYSAPSDGVCNWYLNSPCTTYTHINPFGELLNPQAATWGQEDSDLSTLFPPVTQYGIPYDIPKYGMNASGNGSPRARWCKLRAAVMWKIVRRNAAAKRKGKFPRNY